MFMILKSPMTNIRAEQSRAKQIFGIRIVRSLFKRRKEIIFTKIIIARVSFGVLLLLHFRSAFTEASLSCVGSKV
jgi:hypothetical protein